MKFESPVMTQRQGKQDVTVSPKSVPSHVANRQELWINVRVNKKPVLIGQSVYNLCRPLCDFFGTERQPGGTETWVNSMESGLTQPRVHA